MRRLDLERYFFHIRRGQNLVRDDEGTDLETVAQARQEADSIARFLLADRLRFGQDLVGEQIEIWDRRAFIGAVEYLASRRDPGRFSQALGEAP